MANMLWILINCIGDVNYPQVCMFSVYSILNIQGYKKWSKNNNKGEKSMTEAEKIQMEIKQKEAEVLGLKKKLEQQKKEDEQYTRWKPKKYEAYYFLDSLGDICSNIWCKNKKLMLKENDVDAYTVFEPDKY